MDSSDWGMFLAVPGTWVLHTYLASGHLQEGTPHNSVSLILYKVPGVLQLQLWGQTVKWT